MNLKDPARYWFNRGFNIVTVRYENEENGKVGKRPLIEWREWVSRRQTVEEFEDQPWGQADGFAIVCAYPNSEGLYLAGVDYDVKKVSEEAKRRGKIYFDSFPITRTERTVSGGRRKVYLSKVRPNPVSQYHHEYALELIAGAKLCIMAPSKGYTTLNDNSPRVVEDAEGLFYQILGVEDARNVSKDIGVAYLKTWLEELKPYLKIKGEGSNYIYVHCPFHPPDRNPSFAIHKTKFYGIDFHDGRVYSLKELAGALGLELSGDVSVILGRYILRVKSSNVIVYNEGKPVYATPIKSITSQRAKREIIKHINVDLKDLESAIAQLLDKFGDSKQLIPKTKPGNANAGYDIWRKVLHADLD
jgi:hypothetical protein